MDIASATQWLADNINDVLLFVTNVITIIAAVKAWLAKRKAEKAAATIIQGVEKYSKGEMSPNSHVKIAIEIQSTKDGTKDEVERLVKMVTEVMDEERATS